MIFKKLIQPIRVFNIQIHLSAVVLIAAGFFLEFMHRLLIAYVITAVHEFAHILAARRLGIKIKCVEIMPFGITMRLLDEGIRHTEDEIKVALAGPASNFLIAFAFCGTEQMQYKEYIICTSLVIGIFNLLPALPLDGGRIVRALLVKRFGCIKGSAIAMHITRTTAVGIVVLGVFVLWITRLNFSFLIIGAFLIANITEEKKSINMVIMKDILYSRRKLEQGSEKGEILVASEFERAINILPRLSYDKYYVINIVNTEMRVIYTLTETSFIEGLAILGINTTMRNFVDL